MSGSMKGCCCIELDLFSKIVALISIWGSLSSIFGLYILGHNWCYIIVYIIMAPFIIAASIFLIMATYNKRPSYVVPWLVMAIVGIINTIINQSIWLHHYQDILSVHDVNIHVFGLFSGFTILVYLWLCVYAYYQNLCRVSVDK